MYALTAAHRTLPLGSRVRVTNLENGRHTTVTLTDRGPFVDGRIIDLSYGAGRALGMVGRGVAPVRLEPVDGRGRVRTAAASAGLGVGLAWVPGLADAGAPR
jgi:rare lipoprotein A